MTATTSRYNRVAMSLHWLIALAIIGNLALGWWMHDAIDQADQRALAALAFQWHKSIGLSILLLSILRLLWRLSHRPPALPSKLVAWERRAAHVTHIALYAAMLGVPLSGWLYVSAQWRGDAALSVSTLWFGWIEIPHLFGINHLADAQRQWWANIGFSAHELLAQALAGLMLLHIAAALKHQFYSHDDVLSRMLPANRTTWLVGCFALLAIPAIIGTLASFGPSTNKDVVARIQSSTDGWKADERASQISFSGVHAGEAFQGIFTEWWVDLQLNPENPTQSLLVAKISTASARDGDVLHEETLPQTEWFDSKRYPYAEFISSSVKTANDGGWEIFGKLTIKDESTEVGPLMLKFENNQASLNAQIQVDRADFDLGMQSDPKGKWVSRKIGIDIKLTASPAE